MDAADWSSYIRYEQQFPLKPRANNSTPLTNGKLVISLVVNRNPLNNLLDTILGRLIQSSSIPVMVWSFANIFCRPFPRWMSGINITWGYMKMNSSILIVLQPMYWSSDWLGDPWKHHALHALFPAARALRIWLPSIAIPRIRRRFDFES